MWFIINNLFDFFPSTQLEDVAGFISECNHYSLPQVHLATNRRERLATNAGHAIVGTTYFDPEGVWTPERHRPFLICAFVHGGVARVGRFQMVYI